MKGYTYPVIDGWPYFAVLILGVNSSKLIPTIIKF